MNTKLYLSHSGIFQYVREILELSLAIDDPVVCWFFTCIAWLSTRMVAVTNCCRCRVSSLLYIPPLHHPPKVKHRERATGGTVSAVLHCCTLLVYSAVHRCTVHSTADALHSTAVHVCRSRLHTVSSAGHCRGTRTDTATPEPTFGLARPGDERRAATAWIWGSFED